MSNLIKNNRYLILRRVIQIVILFLFFAANKWGWNILVGSLSTSKMFDTIPLSDPYAVIQMFFAGAVISSDLILGFLIVVAFYGLIAGRAFCSWVCPVNMITDLAGWLRRKLKIDEYGKRQLLLPHQFKYWFALVILIVSAITGTAAFEYINPVGILTRGVIFSMGFGWTWIVAIFLFDLFVMKNGWCSYVCPLGATYSIIGSKSVVKVLHNKDKCTACGNCFKVCPEVHVLENVINKKSGFITGIECRNCGRCIEVCYDEALKFNLKNFVKGVEK